MASSEQQQPTDEQLRFVQECYPQESKSKLLALLRQYHGDVDQVKFLGFQHLLSARLCLLCGRNGGCLYMD